MKVTFAYDKEAKRAHYKVRHGDIREGEFEEVFSRPMVVIGQKGRVLKAVGRTLSGRFLTAVFIRVSGVEAMRKAKKCRKCDIEMYRDDRGEWFCPDCVLQEIEPGFLDEGRDHLGELKRPYVLQPPTKQVSIRLPVGDLALARKLARRKGVPKYQTYIKTLLHEALTREAQEA